MNPSDDEEPVRISKNGKREQSVKTTLETTTHDKYPTLETPFARRGVK
jgi:hypothetical protein